MLGNDKSPPSSKPTKRGQELRWRDYLYSFKGPQSQQLTISSHDVLGVARKSRGKNTIIFRMARHPGNGSGQPNE